MCFDILKLLFYYMIYLYAKFFKYRQVCFRGFTVILAYRNCHVSIGKGSMINSSWYTNLVGMQQRTTIIAWQSGRITIGENCGISGTTLFSIEEITIGDRVLIGANCKIIDHDFHPIKLKSRIENKIEDVQRRSIIIGHDCFIGMNSILLTGTVLGNNCIVGAGSVVSGNFPDNCIIAGNPAKIIRKITD